MPLLKYLLIKITYYNSRIKNLKLFVLVLAFFFVFWLGMLGQKVSIVVIGVYSHVNFNNSFVVFHHFDSNAVFHCIILMFIEIISDFIPKVAEKEKGY